MNECDCLPLNTEGHHSWDCASNKRPPITYDFTLRFAHEANEEMLTFAEKLADSTLGLGRPGYFSLMFTREGCSLDEVVALAVQEVIDVVPTAVHVATIRED